MRDFLSRLGGQAVPCHPPGRPIMGEHTYAKWAIEDWWERDSPGMPGVAGLGRGAGDIM